MIEAGILAYLKRRWPMFAIAFLAVAILSLAYCKGVSAGKSGEVVKQQKREIETQQDLGRANEKAGDQRMKDTMQSTAQQKELEDALAATNDPDRQRALRGCIIMRQQGRDTSHLPACR